MTDSRAHVVHVVHRLDTGGMENGVVNLVNRLPAERFRHTIVSLTGVGAIADRIANPEVVVEALGLRPGPLALALPILCRRFHALRPSIVHTRNVGTLEAQIAAAFAGVPVRIHGEHGWEVHDLVGSNARLLRTRRWMRRFVHQQIALSNPTYTYLRDRVRVPVGRLASICNGVDTERFHPCRGPCNTDPRRGGRGDAASVDAASAATSSTPIVIGYVGRLADVKNPLLLVDAFEVTHALVAARDAGLASRLRLTFVGDGPLADALRRRVCASPFGARITLEGDRDDIDERMRSFDVYALPSLAEGISNTLLEAMASGLPCVATSVGGNAEIVDAEAAATLVESKDADAFARALARYLLDPTLRAAHGARARMRAVERFGIDRMVSAYDALYTDWLVRRRAVPLDWTPRRELTACPPARALPPSQAS